MKKNIIIVDNPTVFLEGLISVLSSQENYHILFASRCAKNVIKYLQINISEKVDLIIINAEIPGMNEIELDNIIKNKFPYIKILVVYFNKNVKIKNQNIDGYISKNTEKKELLKAVKFILEGKQYVPEAEERTRLLKKESNLNDILDTLSNRERDILYLIAKEYKTKDIAEKLCLSKHTINGYRKNMMLKLGTSNGVGLAIWSMKLGLDNHCIKVNK